MKYVLALLLSVPLFALAQTAPPAPPTGTPNICDQQFSAYTSTAAGNWVMFLPGPTIIGQPYADVQANHAEQVKVLDVLSKEQNKAKPGDPAYTVEVKELTACDGGPNTLVPSGSLFVEGVTLQGMNKVARQMLKSGDVIVSRYEEREKKGAKQAWNHSNAPKMTRDDLGNVVPPGQAKKQQ